MIKRMSLMPKSERKLENSKLYNFLSFLIEIKLWMKLYVEESFCCCRFRRHDEQIIDFMCKKAEGEEK